MRWSEEVARGSKGVSQTHWELVGGDYLADQVDVASKVQRGREESRRSHVGRVSDPQATVGKREARLKPLLIRQRFLTVQDHLQRSWSPDPALAPSGPVGSFEQCTPPGTSSVHHPASPKAFLKKDERRLRAVELIELLEVRG